MGPDLLTDRLLLETVVRQPLSQGFLLALQIFRAGAHALQKDLVLPDFALSLEDCVLRGTALALGHLQVVPCGGKLPAGLVLLPLGGGEAFSQDIQTVL